MVAFGVFMILAALLLDSLVGVVSVFIPVKDSLAKTVCRQQMISCIAILFALLEYLYFTRVYKIERKALYRLDSRKLITGFLCGAMFFCWIAGLLFAANNTIQSHAYIFNNFGGTFIVFSCILVGKKIHKLEVYGSFIALAGAFVTLLDSSAATTDGKKPSMLVNLIDLASSGCGAVYFSLILRLKSAGPLFFCIMMVQVSSTIFGIFLTASIDSSSLVDPFNFKNGILSIWAAPDLVWNLLLVGMLTGHFIAICYFVCSQIFSPLFVSSSLLTEPFMAQMMGVAFGIDLMPGLFTYLGTVVTCLGLYIAIRGGQKKSQNGKGEALTSMSFSRSRAL